jgi:hypothetical protein
MDIEFAIYPGLVITLTSMPLKAVKDFKDGLVLSGAYREDQLTISMTGKQSRT